jgi:MYXO-CTERM domain-containing protein
VLRTAAQEETKKTRRVYAYSIVPGGVLDRQELAHAVVVDKVVAEHYAAFETARATVKTVGKPRGVYVSYRKGDKVYWTAKKLQLAQGETVLSDGKNEIRTRCGNRISDVPQLPVEAQGPGEEELDASVEQVQDDDGEGGVEQVGFAVEGNPAGHGYQLRTFGTGAGTQGGNASLTRSSAGMPGFYTSGRETIWDAGVPRALVGGVSSVPADSGSGNGSGGSGTGGTPAGDPQLPTKLEDTSLPSTDTGEKPSAPLPATLLPPTTDLPGTTDKPGGAPTKHGDAPEPGTLWLGAAGVAALLAARRVQKRSRG